MGSAASTAGAAEASVTAEALSTEAAKGLVPRGLWTEACDRRFEELSGAMPRGAAEAEWRNAEHSLRVDDIELGQKVILKALDHSALQREKMGQHLAGTRGWVFTAFDAWLLGAESAESESYDKLFWLLGGGGTGKSVAFAVQLNRLRARGAAIAWHFCRHDNAGASGVTTLIRSLAAMLCATVRGFEEMLRADLVSFFEEKGDLDGMQPAGLFELLVSKPLSKVEPPGQNCVICIDALDELPPKDLGSVLALIVDLFPALPQWVKIFLTSRDEAHIKAALSEQFTPMELKVDGSHNQEDMRAFLRHMARGFFQESLSLADVERDVEKEFEGVQMRDRLAPLAPSLMQSKAVYDDAVARIILRDTQKAYDDLCSAIPDIRPDPLLQSSKSLEALFAEAARAQDVVAAAIADAWETDAASSNVRHPKSGKRPWVESADEPGIKGMPRALEKRDKDYGGDYRRLTDLSRITLRFLDCKGLLGAFEAMRNLPQCTLLQVKNRFGSRTPLGYCDVNALFAFGVLDGDGESVQHIAEVQFNLDEIVLAKKEAHTHYEAVRSQLPDLCAGTKYLAADLEASIMKKLENSTLDAFVKVLEDKAKGLFIFAQLLNDHLARAGAGQSFAALDGVPAGLDEIYLTNFRRCCADDAEWRECAGLVALIVAAREPLSADIARGIMGVAVFAKVADKLSILFPIIDGKLSVLHKTVTDWLRRDDRAGERFFLSPDQIAEAHFKLARALEAALPSEVYAISHVVYHQVRAADASADGAEKSESLRKTLRNAAFVAQRVSLGQRADLAKDYTDALARAGKRSARALKEWSKFTPLYASFLADFPQHATSCARNFGPASTSCVAEDAAAAPASAAHWAFANTPTTTDALVTKMESGEHTRNKYVIAAVASQRHGVAYVAAGGGGLAIFDTASAERLHTVEVVEVKAVPNEVTAVALAENNDGLDAWFGDDYGNVHRCEGLEWTYDKGDVLRVPDGEVCRGHRVIFVEVAGSMVVAGTDMGCIATFFFDEGTGLPKGAPTSLKRWSTARVTGEHCEAYCLVRGAGGAGPRWIVSAHGRSLKVWDAAKGMYQGSYRGLCEYEIASGSQPMCAAAHPSEDRFLSGHRDFLIREWRIGDDKTPLRTIQDAVAHDRGHRALAYSGAGAVLASTWESTILRVWDAAGKLTAELKGHQSGIVAIHAVQGPDDLMLSCDHNATILWEMPRPADASGDAADGGAAPEAGDAPRLAEFAGSAWCGFAGENTIVVVDSNFRGGGVFAFSSAGPDFGHLWTRSFKDSYDFKLLAYYETSFDRSVAAFYTAAGDAHPTIAVNCQKSIVLLDAATGDIQGEVVDGDPTSNSFDGYATKFISIAFNAAGILVGANSKERGQECVSWDCAQPSRGDAWRRLRFPLARYRASDPDPRFRGCDVNAAGLALTANNWKTDVWDARTGHCLYKIPFHGYRFARWFDASHVLVDVQTFHCETESRCSVAIVNVENGEARQIRRPGKNIDGIGLVASEQGQPGLLTTSSVGALWLHDAASDYESTTWDDGDNDGAVRLLLHDAASGYVFTHHSTTGFTCVDAQRLGTLVVATSTTAGIFVLDRAGAKRG